MDNGSLTQLGHPAAFINSLVAVKSSLCLGLAWPGEVLVLGLPLPLGWIIQSLSGATWTGQGLASASWDLTTYIRAYTSLQGIHLITGHTSQYSVHSLLQGLHLIKGHTPQYRAYTSYAYEDLSSNAHEALLYASY